MKAKEAVFKHKVVANLDRKEIDFLDTLGKDALFSTGHKLTYDEILQGLVDFARESGVSGEGKYSWQSLKEAFLESGSQSVCAEDGSSKQKYV